MHSALALLPVLLFIPLLVLTVPVLFRLLRPCRLSDLTPDWLENFQVSSYHPMRGLLAPDDFRFLSSQPGFDPSLFRKLRHDRLRIFRQYLNRMILDFNRLHTLAQLVISQTSQDQSDLFTRLLALRFRFWLAVLQVEFSYAICRLGLNYISVGGAIQRLDDMRRELTTLPQPKSLFAN